METIEQLRMVVKEVLETDGGAAGMSNSLTMQLFYVLLNEIIKLKEGDCCGLDRETVDSVCSSKE